MEHSRLLALVLVASCLTAGHAQHVLVGFATPQWVPTPPPPTAPGVDTVIAYTFATSPGSGQFQPPSSAQSPPRLEGARTLVSIGGPNSEQWDAAYAQLPSYTSNAVASLTDLITSNNLDGIDLQYVNFNYTKGISTFDGFAPTWCNILRQVKAAQPQIIITTTPDSGSVGAYIELYAQCGWHLISWTNFFTYEYAVRNPEYHQLALNDAYKAFGGASRVTIGLSSVPGDTVLSAAGAEALVEANPTTKGVAIWTFDQSARAGYSLEKQLLASWQEGSEGSSEDSNEENSEASSEESIEESSEESGEESVEESSMEESSAEESSMEESSAEESSMEESPAEESSAEESSAEESSMEESSAEESSAEQSPAEESSVEESSVEESSVEESSVTERSSTEESSVEESSPAGPSELPPWAQCGGKSGVCGTPGFGPCQDTTWASPICPAGFSCVRNNEWYWQCLPIQYTDPAILPRFGQCGGLAGSCGQQGAGPCEDAQWAGLRCPDGFRCNRSSQWYYQCLPTYPYRRMLRA